MKKLLLSIALLTSLLFMLASCGPFDSSSGASPVQKKKVILFVWDGL
jgi:hypothetical protein